MRPATLLAQEAAAGNTARVAELLQEAPALAADWQPIMDACFWGRAAIVKLLLERGADPNVMAKTNYRHRPLHRTVEHKVTTPRGPEHLEVVEVLLAAGADVTARGTWAMITPVAVAALGGELQFLPPLLRRLPESDLYTAAVLGDAERVTGLLAKEPALARRPDENGWPALQYCASSRVDAGDPERQAALLEIARELLKHGADPNPALGPAMMTNKPEIAELLLDHGATVQDGDSLVHTAEGGNFAVLDLLARRGADLQCTVGTEHHGGYTPLGCLMTIRSARGARWFLKQGIDPNHVGGERGETALHVAVRYGCAPETLRLLLDHGVDLNARDRDGQTALALALTGNKTKAAEFLRGQGATP
jgi:ankyrin repeat protein